MRKVYYLNNAVIFVTSEEHDSLSPVPPKASRLAIDTNTLGAEADTILGLTNLRKIFETAKYVTFVSSTQAECNRMFTIFASQFVLVEAGGGLVTAPRGEVLMIYRNRRWDLPKGKLDPGEDIEQCAIREVQEECGIKELKLGCLLTQTYHIYKMNNKPMLKRTTWYAMTNEGVEPLIPQTEEGITDIRWISPMSQHSYVKTSYPTIQDVFVASQKDAQRLLLEFA